MKRDLCIMMIALALGMACMQASAQYTTIRSGHDPRTSEHSTSHMVVPGSSRVRPGQLEMVDQRVGDVGGPLSTSLRQLPIDLRSPIGFERIYRVHGLDDSLLRASGALVAVFPQSEYGRDDDGNVTRPIPGGTVYYIGEPSAIAQQLIATQSQMLANAHLPGAPSLTPRSTLFHPDRQHLRFESRASARPLIFAENLGTEPDENPTNSIDDALDAGKASVPAWIVDRDIECARTSTIITDSAYAAARIRSLLARAADAELQRVQGP